MILKQIAMTFPNPQAVNDQNFETKMFTWKSNIKWVVREAGIA